MNTHTRAVFGAALACAMAACGGSGGGSDSGSVTGTVAGAAIKVESAVSTSTTTQGGTVGVVILTSAADACTLAMSSTVHPNQASLLFELADVSGGSAFTVPTAPATYEVISASTTDNPTHVANVIAAIDDANCQATGDETDDTATTGSVVLTKVDGLSFTGTFDITLGTGDELKGDFDSESCDLTGSGSGSSTCK